MARLKSKAKFLQAYNQLYRFYVNLVSFLTSPIWLYRNSYSKPSGLLYYLDLGSVIGNVKYAMAYHVKHAKDIPIRGLAHLYTEQIERIEELGIPVCLEGTKCENKFLRDSAMFIVRSTVWSDAGRYWRFLGKPVLQLWHGVGIKYVGLLYLLDGYRCCISKKGFILLKVALKQSFTSTWILSTSPFYTYAWFERLFPTSGGVIELGNYPRNDIFFLSNDEIKEMFDERIYNIGIDQWALNRIRKEKRKGKKVVLLAFTYREGHRYDKSIYYEQLSPQYLATVAEKYGMFFVMKLHPFDELIFGNNLNTNIEKYSNHMVIYGSGKVSDIQPLLREVDALVTDYSSVYADFTLMPTKPIVFYPYDYDEYMAKRKICFPYDLITPGPKVRDREELFEVLNEMLRGKDEYYRDRVKFSKLAFKRHDVVSPLLFKFIRWALKKKGYMQ